MAGDETEEVEPLPIFARDPCLWWWLDGERGDSRT